MTNTNKPNDFIAASINGANENLSLDDLRYYNITPDNTGIQSKDYYKSIPKVKDLFIDKDGKFDEEKYNAWYNDTLDMYNTWANDNFEQKMIDSMERSSYNIFELGNNNIADDTAKIISAKDPERTSRGLTDPFSVNGPSFDIREVAQANKVLDENGNELDWSPNDKGGLFKALTRPALALAQWEEDGWHMENGIKVEHHAGDLRLGSNGDPQYQILGKKSAVGRDILHYTDTFTRDDEWLNKFDFFDNDGLKKSVGGTIARTSFMLLPMFIPGVNTAVGWAGAALALAQTLPGYLRSVQGTITGNNDNAFGRQMNQIENYFSRFGTTMSRSAQNSFFNKENLGEMIASSAAQLFQQRNIINAAGNLIKMADANKARKLGSAISLGYMALTSSGDSYEIMKQAGLSDRMASMGQLAITGMIFGLMNSGYLFKDAMFKDTWLAEDQERRQMIKTLADYGKSQMTKAQIRAAERVGARVTAEEAAENLKWFGKMQKAAKNWLTKGDRAYQESLMKAESIADVQLAQTPFWQSLLGRGLNEGIEEVMEESATDAYKIFTLGLDSLGVNITDENKDLDFKETWADVLGRYATAFLGGYVGGMTFEAFSEWDKLARNKFKKTNINRNLITNLVASISNPEAKAEIENQINELEKKGKLGNKNLSARPEIVYDDEDPTKASNVIFGEGTDEDNQNKANASFMRYLVRNIETSINDHEIKPADVISQAITAKFITKALEKGQSLEEYLKSEGVNPEIFIMQQKGALDGVYSEMIDKSVDIVTIDQKIKQRRQEILTKYGDTRHAEADVEIKKDQTIKQWTKELNQLKEEYKEMEEGSRADFYASILNFASDGEKMSAYLTDEHLFNTDDNTVIPLTNAENYVRIKYGVKLDDPNLSDAYKQSKREEWENYKNNILPKKVWQAHQLHYNLTEQLSPKITSIDTALQGYNTEGNFVDIYSRYYDAMLAQVDNMLALTDSVDTERIAKLTKLRSDINNEKTSLNDRRTYFENFGSSTDPEKQKQFKESVENVSNTFMSLTNFFQEGTTVKDLISFLNLYYSKLVDDKIITNQDYSMFNSVAENIATLLHNTTNFAKALTPGMSFSEVLAEKHVNMPDRSSITNSVDHAVVRCLNLRNSDGSLGTYPQLCFDFWNSLFPLDPTNPSADLNTKLSDETTKAFSNIVYNLVNNIDRSDIDLTDDDEIYWLLEEVNVIDPSDDLIQNIKDLLSRVDFNKVEEINNKINDYINKNPLLFKETLQSQVLNELNVLSQAFQNFNYAQVRDSNFKINKLIEENISDPDAQNLFKQYLFVGTTAEGDLTSFLQSDDVDDFLKVADVEGGLLTKLGKNPIWDLLAQLDTFTNGKFGVAINRVKSEHDRFSALGTNADQEYVINELEIQKELETVKSLLNLVSTVLGGAVDGSNALVNQYRNLVSLPAFATISDNARQILAEGMDSINRIVDMLLETSKRNALKQMRMQKDTFVKCYPLLAQKVKEIIETGDTYGINVDDIWKTTCGDLVLENITAENFADHKKNIDEFYEKLREEIIKKTNEKGKTIVDYLKDRLTVFNTLYLQAQTELSPDTTQITDLTGFQQLVMNLLESPEKVDSIYNYVRKLPEFAGIIPFMGQELMLKNAFIVGNHKNEINELNEFIYNQAHDNYRNPDSRVEKYIQTKQPLGNVIHFDGTAGAGKTEITRMLGKMFEAQKKGTKVKQVYSAMFQDHVERNMKPRLGDSYSYVNLSEILKKALGDYYENDSAHKLIASTTTLTKEAEEEIKKNLDEKWSEINPFNGEDDSTVKILVIDEDGFVNPFYWQVISKIALKANALVVGTGDSAQNGAFVGKTQQSFEDCLIWTTPHLSISMRAQNRGKLLNQNLLYSTINKINNTVENRVENKPSEYAARAKTVLQETPKSLIGHISENDVSGEVLVNTEDEALALAKKLKAKVDSENNAETDPNKKNHAIIIVTNNPTRWNIPALQGDSVIILDKNSVQGGQADYVIIDRNDWDENEYYTLKDLYTMTSRSKFGTVIINKPNSSGHTLNDILHISFTSEESSDFIPDPAKKKEELDSYKTWREDLFDKTSKTWDPEVEAATSPTGPATSAPTSTSSTSSSAVSSTSSSAPTSSSTSSEPIVREEFVEEAEEESFVKDKTPEEVENEYIKNAEEERKNHLDSSTVPHGDFQVFLNELDEDSKKSNPELITKGLGRAMLNSGKSKENITKALKLLAKIVIQGKSLGLTSVDESIRRTLMSLGVTTDVINGFCNTLDGEQKGYFYITEGTNKTVFYIFNDQQGHPIFIPVFKYIETDPASKYEQTVDYDDVSFDEINGTNVRVTTNGNVRKKLNTVFPDLDEAELAILAIDEDPRNPDAKDLGFAPEESKNIWKFVFNNNGKAFLVVPKYAGYSFGTLLTPTKDKNGKITYLLNKKGEKTLGNLVGVQSTINIKDFLEIAKAKNILIGGTTNSEARNKAFDVIEKYFGPEARSAFFTKLGTTGSSAEGRNMAELYKAIAPYSAIHWTSVGKLFSATFRYVEQLNDSEIKKKFYEKVFELFNKAGWYGKNKKYKSAISFNVVTGNSTVGISLEPVEDSKFRLWISQGKDDVQNGGNVSVDGQLFNLEDYGKVVDGQPIVEELVTRIFNILSNGNTDTQKVIQEITTDNLIDKFKSGEVFIGFTKLRREESELEPSSIYQAFDDDLGKIFEDTFDTIIDNFSDWLSKDSVFKYQLYANITGEYLDSDSNWKHTKYNPNYHTSDIVAYYEPGYEININRSKETEDWVKNAVENFKNPKNSSKFNLKQEDNGKFNFVNNLGVAQTLTWSREQMLEECEDPTTEDGSPLDSITNFQVTGIRKEGADYYVYGTYGKLITRAPFKAKIKSGELMNAISKYNTPEVSISSPKPKALLTKVGDKLHLTENQDFVVTGYWNENGKIKVYMMDSKETPKTLEVDESSDLLKKLELSDTVKGIPINSTYNALFLDPTSMKITIVSSDGIYTDATREFSYSNGILTGLGSNVPVDESLKQYFEKKPETPVSTKPLETPKSGITAKIEKILTNMIPNAKSVKIGEISLLNEFDIEVTLSSGKTLKTNGRYDENADGTISIFYNDPKEMSERDTKQQAILVAQSNFKEFLGRESWPVEFQELVNELLSKSPRSSSEVSEISKKLVQVIKENMNRANVLRPSLAKFSAELNKLHNIFKENNC